VADEVGLVGRRIDSGGAIDFAISTNATLPDLTCFGGGFYAGRAESAPLSVHAGQPTLRALAFT
jgi:hypothetical protein